MYGTLVEQPLLRASEDFFAAEAQRLLDDLPLARFVVVVVCFLCVAVVFVRMCVVGVGVLCFCLFMCY